MGTTTLDWFDNFLEYKATNGGRQGNSLGSPLQESWDLLERDTMGMDSGLPNPTGDMSQRFGESIGVSDDLPPYS